jgi:predicted dehydrogenase
LAVVGFGRAGRARIRATEVLPDVELAGVVTRSDPDGAPSLKKVLQDRSVDAVCVCNPNLLHAELARQILLAGKHAIVEYPLAPGPLEASELFALAHHRDRVLHVEHIEVLAPSHEEQRRRSERLGRLIDGTLHFQAAGEGWIQDPALAGSAALRAVARLHRLVDLFGEAHVERASIDDYGPKGTRLEVRLRFLEGGHVTLIEERRTDGPRRADWDLACERGRLRSPPSGPAGRLFERDLEHFVERVREGTSPYVTEDRIVHVLDLVRSIEEHAAL